MVFKPGQSGNPSGRKRLDPDVRARFVANGEKAAQLMADMLEDPAAWGPDGWIPAKDQIVLLEKAMDRAFGKSEVGDAVDTEPWAIATTGVAVAASSACRRNAQFAASLSA